MNSPDAPRRTRWRLWLLVFVIALAGGAGVAFWGYPQQAARGLDSHWAAAVRVIAGDGTIGTRDGDAWKARFADPFDVAIGGDGTIYVADGVDAHRIRAIAPAGVVRTIAGSTEGFTDGPASAAQFSTPSGIAVDSAGTLYVADTGNHAIRRIAPDGQVTTLAGDGTPGAQDGPGAGARFNGPMGVAVDGRGRVIVADTYNDRIRAVETDGQVRTIAGTNTPGVQDGPPDVAQFDTPAGVAVSSDGTIYVADTGNGLLRAIDADGAVRTISLSAAEGAARPIGVAVDARDFVYVTDERGRIIEVSPEGDARLLAGSSPGYREGRDARFRRPAGIASIAPGRLVVADAGNAMVRLVEAWSLVTAVPPSSPLIVPRFDLEAFADRPLLWPLAPQYGPFEIAGTLGEARGEGAGRFHAGIDIRADQGTPVLAVRAGTVRSPVSTGELGTLNEWLRIGPLTYVHIRAGRTRRNEPFDDPRFAITRDETGHVSRIRVKRGARFAAGDLVGTINPFNHVHLNVGWPGEEYNPLLVRLPQLVDTVPPTIPRGGVRLYDAFGTEFTKRVEGRLLVSGPVRIVVDAWDQMDGNRPNRRLGLYALGYEVLANDGTPVHGMKLRKTMLFNQLRADAEAAPLVFAPGSGIPFYGERRTRFLYVVTNTFRDGVAAPGFWDTRMLAPGDYTLRVHAADAAGNEAMSNRDLAVTVVAPMDRAAEAP